MSRQGLGQPRNQPAPALQLAIPVPVLVLTLGLGCRGMDYPDVTFVLQVGAPSDRAQYIHRIGETTPQCRPVGSLPYSLAL
jgi:hypothetical protein